MSGLFFSLIDECDGSDRRLDVLAEPLLRELAELEDRAASVIDDRRSEVARAHDYLDRLRGVVRKLEEKKPAVIGDNQGPPIVAGSAALPPPSSDAPQLPPPSIDMPEAPQPDAPVPGEAPPA